MALELGQTNATTTPRRAHGAVLPPPPWCLLPSTARSETHPRAPRDIDPSPRSAPLHALAPFLGPSPCSQAIAESEHFDQTAGGYAHSTADYQDRAGAHHRRRASIGGDGGGGPANRWRGDGGFGGGRARSSTMDDALSSLMGMGGQLLAAGGGDGAAAVAAAPPPPPPLFTDGGAPSSLAASRFAHSHDVDETLSAFTPLDGFEWTTPWQVDKSHSRVDAEGWAYVDLSCCVDRPPSVNMAAPNGQPV